jgi:hypothetical protein
MCPGKKASHEIKDAETPLVKAIEKDFTHAPSLMRKRKLVRQIAKFVENNKKMERVTSPIRLLGSYRSMSSSDDSS